METARALISNAVLLLHRDKNCDFQGWCTVSDNAVVLSGSLVSLSLSLCVSVCLSLSVDYIINWTTVFSSSFCPLLHCKWITELSRATARRHGVDHCHQRSLASCHSKLWSAELLDLVNAELDNIWMYNAFYFPLDCIVSSKSRAAITLQCIIWMEIWTP